MQTGSTAPVSLSPNSHITRVLYLFNTRPARGGVPATITRVIISAGGSDGVPSSFPHRERYGPIVAERKWAVFTPVGVNTIHTSHSSFQRSEREGAILTEDDSYRLEPGGRRSWKRNQSTDFFGFNEPFSLAYRGVLSLEYLLHEFSLFFILEKEDRS